MQIEKKIIDLSYNGGGKQMDKLVEFISTEIGILSDQTDIVGPEAKDDSAVLPFYSNNIVMTTDSHTVDPVFFQGGNIGDLAVCGTINDIVAMGAKPLYMTLGMVIEEGFTWDDLRVVCNTIGIRLREAGVRIVAGDTKVMPSGTISNIVLNTSCVGVLARDSPLSDSNAKIGDTVIITSEIGVHGTSLLALREGLKFETELESDVDHFWPYFENLIRIPGLHAMKDVTRGGLSSALNEIATKSKVCIEIIEENLPIKSESQAICDMLGLEIMEISGEGVYIIVCSSQSVSQILDILTSTPRLNSAAVIGFVKSSDIPQVHVKTKIGGTRLLDKPFGEPIPRVC